MICNLFLNQRIKQSFGKKLLVAVFYENTLLKVDFNHSQSMRLS